MSGESTQSVALSGDYTFSAASALLNVTLANGNRTIQLGGTGVPKAFRIAWRVTGFSYCSWSVTVNGEVQPELNFSNFSTTYPEPMSSAGGEAIVTIPDNAVLTLRNLGSSCSVGSEYRAGTDGFLTVIQIQ